MKNQNKISKRIVFVFKSKSSRQRFPTIPTDQTTVTITFTTTGVLTGAN